MTISKFSGKHSFLSNFHQHTVRQNGIAYATNEHYYQAFKSLSRSHRMRFSRIATPKEAKRCGQALQLRPDWEAVKHQVMLDAIRLKFKSPKSELGKLLLATGDQLLIEGNTWDDTIWGAVYNSKTKKWTGENWLGNLLMLRRAELRAM